MLAPGLKAGTQADGPYLFHLPDGRIRMIAVSPDGAWTDTIYASREGAGFPVWSDRGEFLFHVQLHPVKRENWKQPLRRETTILSDPHGDLESLVSFLKGNRIIDHHYNWTYGKNQLIINGDVFDRGNDVLAIFWLIYKLEHEAEAAGGKVSFLLGNHETMVLGGDLRYMKPKYQQLAERLDTPYETLFGPDTELGRWLSTRNTLQRNGKYLIVHAGLSRPFLERNLSAELVNTTMSEALFRSKADRKNISELTGFLYGNDGPVWYRGMVRDQEKYNPVDPEVVKAILKRYKADRIVVGHTVFKDISLFQENLVIGVNVDNAKNRKEERGRAIVIRKNKIYVADDNGSLRLLY